MHRNWSIWHCNISMMHHDRYLVVLSVEEADVEDPEGNVSKELYVLPVTPLESHAVYRLETEDLDIFSDGSDDDKEGWICPRVWPQIPIPVHRQRPTPSTSRVATSLASEAFCGSSHSQLKKDLLQQHHNLVKCPQAQPSTPRV